MVSTTTLRRIGLTTGTWFTVLAVTWLLIGVSFYFTTPSSYGAAVVFTNNGAPAVNLNPGMVDILALDITLPAIDSDTVLDCDGSATTGADCPGLADTIVAGDALIKNFVAAGVFCADTDGTTVPTNLVLDTDGACNDGDTVNETVILGGNAALNNLDDAAASSVLFNDENTNGVWDTGEDIFFDVDDSQLYNADTLDAITVRNSGTAVDTTDITTVKLWRESTGNGAFSTADTVLDSDCTWDGADDWECDVNHQFTVQTRVYVTVSVATGATNSRTIQMQVAVASDAGTADAFDTGDTGIFFSDAGAADTGNHDGPSSAITNANVHTIVVPPVAPPPPDTTPPSAPSIIINSGDANTLSQNVTLTLAVTDGDWMDVSEDARFVGVAQVKFTGGSQLMELAFTLSEGDGTKTVYVRFMDEAGNFSETVSDTIVLGALPAEEAPTEQAPPSGQVTPDSSTIDDGDLLRASNTVEVYVTKKVGATVIIRHIVNPRIFDIYGHFGGVKAWEQVKGVDTLGSARVSAWVRGSDGKVYEVNGDGTRHHMNMSWEQFAARVAAGDSQLATDLIFEVNDDEVDLYDQGVDVLP